MRVTGETHTILECDVRMVPCTFNYITAICLAILRTRDFTFYRFVSLLRLATSCHQVLAPHLSLACDLPVYELSFAHFVVSFSVLFSQSVIAEIALYTHTHHFSPSLSIRAHRLHNCTNKFLFAHFYQNLIFTLHFWRMDFHLFHDATSCSCLSRSVNYVRILFFSLALLMRFHRDAVLLLYTDAIA